MTTTIKLVTLTALLAAIVNVAWGAESQYQPTGDSTGGRAQAKGDLLATHLQASPGTSDVAARRHLAAVRDEVRGGVTARGDSTGESSRLHGDLDYETAEAAGAAQ